MEELELDEKNCQVVWNTSAKQAQTAVLGWRMLENNEIPGILPFDYYYIDDRVCFRCPYAPYERIGCYFQKNSGDFQSIYCICKGILKILERGEEYLLGREGYLLLPEWVFWNRFEKKVAVCYFPGRDASVREEYLALVEYLMQHTDHSDKRAVALVYGLYDMVVSESFIIENLLQYIRKGAVAGAEEAGGTKKLQERRESVTDGKDKVCRFHLVPVKNSLPGRLQGRIAEGQKAGGCLEEGRELTVGRQEGSGIYLPFSVISRRHAVFLFEGSKLYLMDISSKNGTYLNGKKISAYVKVRCRRDDVITFADISYRFEDF